MSTVPPYDVALLEEARALGSATLHEASGLPASAVDAAIRTVWSGARIAGPAYPIECTPGDNLAIHLGLEKAPRGSVLVVATGGVVAGYWGEVLTVAAAATGIVGLVIDGGVRDIAAIGSRRFPVFTRGISVRGTIKASVRSIGQPLSFTGTPVAAGDLVVADDDGVIVIPAAHAVGTVAAGRARADNEAWMMEELLRGRTTVDVLGLARWRTAQ